MLKDQFCQFAGHNGARVMETETIQKNGARPKSQRVGFNFQKLATAVMLLCLFGFATTAVAQTSGTTGECTWTLTGTGDNLTLTISGTGAMGDYELVDDIPWYSNQTNIKTVIINDGVTTIGNWAFSNSGLNSVDFPNSVTTIGECAFYQCNGLTSVDIPNSVINIGMAAFSNCTGLISVNIGNSVTTIGRYVFTDCSSLTSVSIGNSVTTIGDFAFDGCSGLTTIHVDATNPNYCSEDGVLFNKTKTELIVYPGGKQGEYTIPNTVTTIGDYAFMSCRGLTSVSIPNTVTTIGRYAFSRSGLMSVTLPNSVMDIGSGAFSDCSDLSSVSIGNSVISISDRAFYECSSLSSVSIGNSVTNIGDYAFHMCIGLTEILCQNPVPPALGSDVFRQVNTSTCKLYVPAGSRAAYQTAAGWMSFGNIIEEEPPTTGTTGDCTWTLTGTGDNLTLTISGTGAMGDYGSGGDAPWYSNRANIKTLVIENGVTTIGKDAFAACSNLTSVEIANSVISIREWAFGGCSSLTNITVPNSVTLIEENAFYDSGLISASIGNSVASMIAAFSNCNSLTSIEVAADNNYYSSENDILFNKDKTALITYPARKSGAAYNVPNSVTLIERNAFFACKNLTSVNIGNSVKQIRTEAFIFCQSLTDISIGNSVELIENGAFYNCYKLTSINVAADNNDYSSENGVLFNKNKTKLVICPAYKSGSYSIPNSVISIENGAFTDSRLTSVTIPNSVTSIGIGSFSYCRALISVDIPSSVISIDRMAFYNCSNLTTVTIPSSVTLIGRYTFANCGRLADVYVYWTTPLSINDNVSYDVFNGVAIQNVRLHIPQGTTGLYEAADVWRDFDIIDNATSGIQDVSGQPLRVSVSGGELSISCENSVRKVEIYNLSGILVVEESNFAGKINVASLPAGVYIVRAGNETAKFVKE